MLDGYEADENNLIIYEIEEGERWKLGLGDWDRSPKSVKWCPSGEKIYLLADVCSTSSLPLAISY